jgi:hypothetical protein
MLLKSEVMSLLVLGFFIITTRAAPALAAAGSSQVLANKDFGPIPGKGDVFSNFTSKAIPFPANYTAPILPTTLGVAGPDDGLFQNLLSAEWVIYSFYAKAVESFNETAFSSLGFPNTTYERVTEIRNNEAGHLRIFQNQISSNSVKPGACEYAFPFQDPTTFLAIATLLEISSMAFLTGLVQQANLNVSKGALMAIAETESRHNTWSLIDIWDVSPFAGPSDTSYPYASQILAGTEAFIIPGSCPKANPVFPTPNQMLPTFTAGAGTVSLTPGSDVTYNFSNPGNQPNFNSSKDYYAVYFHGLFNVSVPFNTTKNMSTIPAEIESEKGVIIAVIADEIGAPTLDRYVHYVRIINCSNLTFFLVS